MKRLLLLSAALVLVGGPPAAAANRSIVIGSAFTPSIVVVTPGTGIIWRNQDSKPHAITGQLNVSTLQPGQSTAPRVIRRVGQYRYSLVDNGAVRGTIVVARRAPHPAQAPGSSTHAFRGSMTLRVNEKYTFFDSDWRSTSGACNAEVGNGSRNVLMNVSLPNVKYFRGPAGESLSQRNARVRWLRYAELVSGKTTTSASREVTCQDGTTTDQTADQSVDCFKDYAGRTRSALFAWSPTTAGRFELAVRGPALSRCGSSYAGILQVLGAPSFGLPVNVIDRRFNYSAVSTTPTTARETRGIRAGNRTVHIIRRINLSFTTGCCDGYQPQGEADTRVGTIHQVTARLDIRLRPR